MIWKIFSLSIFQKIQKCALGEKKNDVPGSVFARRIRYVTQGSNQLSAEMFPFGLTRKDIERNEGRCWPSAILHVGIGEPKLFAANMYYPSRKEKKDSFLRGQREWEGQCHQLRGEMLPWRTKVWGCPDLAQQTKLQWIILRS